MSVNDKEQVGIKLESGLGKIENDTIE